MSATNDAERNGMPSSAAESKQHQGPFDGLSHLAGGLEVGPTPTDDYEEVSILLMLNDGGLSYSMHGAHTLISLLFFQYQFDNVRQPKATHCGG